MYIVLYLQKHSVTYCDIKVDKITFLLFNRKSEHHSNDKNGYFDEF